MGEESRKDFRKEVAKLLMDQSILEVKYTTWLTNVVMVRMLNIKLRIWTNYTNLNKHYSCSSLMCVITYLSVGGRGSARGCIFQEKKTLGSCHQRLFEGNIRKTKKRVYEF